MIKVTVGVTAFNEEANIGLLLTEILAQKQLGFEVSRIIVNSDGSTDRTTDEVRKIKNGPIGLINNKVRRGKFYRECEIFAKSDDEVVVILDADITLKDELFLKKLVTPILKGADLTSSRVLATEPHSTIEKALFQRLFFQDRLYRALNRGDSVYSCHGVARAFSRRFYQKIKYRKIAGEDAYTYFLCQKNRLRYTPVESAIAYIKVPATTQDNFKQSTRFNWSVHEMEKIFGEKTVAAGYRIPKGLLVKQVASSFVKSPFYFTYYLILLFLKKFARPVDENHQPAWSIAVSSKRLEST